MLEGEKPLKLRMITGFAPVTRAIPNATCQWQRRYVTLRRIMMKSARILPLLLVSLLLTGCRTTVTNLTPTQIPRSSTGQYVVEAAFDTTQQSIRPSSVTPYVVVDFDAYPMRPTLGIANRYEAHIPAAADRKSINYHFKVDYRYNAMGEPKAGSILSRGYKLRITD